MALLISNNFAESGPRMSTVKGAMLCWLYWFVGFFFEENNDSKQPINAQHIWFLLGFDKLLWNQMNYIPDEKLCKIRTWL